MTVDETQGTFAGQREEPVPEQPGQRQVRIGVFVIAGLIATVYLLFLLTDPSTFRGRYKVTTTVENVMGLRKGDPVQMRGVTVGGLLQMRPGLGSGRGSPSVPIAWAASWDGADSARSGKPKVSRPAGGWRSRCSRPSGPPPPRPGSASSKKDAWPPL